MRIPAGTLAFLLLTLPCIAQQSAQSSDQNQKPSQSQDQSQPQDQAGGKSQSQQPPAKRPSTAEENPFPEDISRKAAAATGNSTPDTPSPNDSAPPASSGGSSSPGKSGTDRSAEHPASGNSSSRTGLRSLDDDTAAGRISDGAGGYIHSPKLAAQDVKVGGFYFDNGDYKGAYSRFKEATKVDPGNADAVFGLAEAARALKLNSEAADNYRIYLDAIPNGSKAKAARKALAALGEPPKK